MSTADPHPGAPPPAPPTVALSIVEPEPTVVMPLPLRPDTPRAPAAGGVRGLAATAWGWLTAADG